MNRLPRICEVRCFKMSFAPGDRILVRLKCRLDADQRRRLQRTIERWAGDGVPVLLVDCAEVEIDIETTFPVVPSEQNQDG